MWCSLLLVVAVSVGPVLLVAGAQVPGPGPGLTRKRSPIITDTASIFTAGYSTQMQSRAVDTRVTLEVAEGQPRGTTVGHIPRKSGFTYRFNEPPREFVLDPATGEITTNVVLDREALLNDRYDLVVLSSQPTYPIEVRIVVTDINDNPPEFPEAIITVSFSESAAPGTRLLLDAATDRDSGKNGVSEDYRIIAGNKDDNFKLAVTPNPTGETAYLHLETTGKLDRESQGFYTLNISARDDGAPPKHGYLQVNVTVLDVNDNPPIFDHSDYIVSLNESVPPGTSVLQVMATDNDLGDNSKITYYLADTERQFTVDPETGIISTTEHLECPQQQSCSQTVATLRGNCPKSCVFTVFARDHGSPRQDGRTYVTVNLVDANDHDPIIRFQYFPPTSAFATVDENAGNGTVVAAVSVMDVDEGPNGETTVRIVSGNELNHFRLEYTTSFDLVRVLGVLDREEISKYNLTIVATDKGNPPRTATAFLIIHVNDVNDHEPVFAKSEYSAVLSELAPPGTYVAGITATDEDSGVNAQIYYAFVFGNKHEWFDIDSKSGLITTKATLNREIQGTVELNISARDGGPNPKWAHTQLKVTILDENDEAPAFSQSSINVTLSESSPPNTLVAMLTAADHDQGTNGSVTYLLHPTVEQKYPKIFALDPLTGQLTTRSKIDRELQSFYEIQVIARDQGIPSQSSTATVNLNVLDINDNSPIFYPQMYFVAVPDDVKIGVSLLKVSATDLDEGDNAMIRYKLESGGESLFSVDEWSGVLTLKGNFIATMKPIYKINISARDHGNKRAVSDAVVEIIKEAYMEELQFDSYGYEFQIAEDYGADGTNSHREVGRVHVKTSEIVTYSIIYGDSRHCFTIDEHTGIIKTTANIDREQTIIYTLTIIARVGLSYGKTIVTIVVLDVNDNKPVFLRDKDEIKLLENTAVGQEVYLARARDLDAGINSRIIYTLNYNPDDQFRISETTGVVYLHRPVLAEPNSILQLEVTAVDRGEPELSSKYTIIFTVEDVNDHTPVFDHTSYETSLAESTQVNERFFALSASDADCGINSRVLYAITEGNVEKKFGVFPDGFLYVRSPLDREDKDYYSLTVTVSDLGSPARSSIVPVVIHVIDENDNAPEFTNSTFTFRVRENEPPDSFVGKLTATDKDIGRNAELLYSLEATQTDFVIDPRNGFIKTVTAFDREELVQRTGHNFIMLEAVVTDNGRPRLIDKVKVKIYVTDVNDNAPKFLRVPYKVQISEGASVGTQVLRLYTTDADEGLNGDVFYSISTGNEERRFDVDDATGQIVVVRALDREITAKYTLTVIAHDAALNNKLRTETNVVIDVLDENDNAPEFTQTNSKISVVETTRVATEIIQFRATDADLGFNADVAFSISVGNRRDTFHIDPTTGILSLHKALDYEDLSSYQLNISASDNGNPRLTTTILFAIAVQDANDNPPAFPNTALVRQIQEGIPVHTPIVTVTAEDPDSGLNGKVTYRISYQEPDDHKRHFGINPITGVIHTLLPIDREGIDTFRLTVSATDQAADLSSRLSAEKLVTVIVEDINDNAPIFVSMNSALLPTDSIHPGRDGTLVMNVLAKDRDSSTNGLVTYELVSGNMDLFKLHRSTGALTLQRPLPMTETRYKLSLKATDEAVQSERKSTETYVTIIAPGEDNSNKGAPVFESQPFVGSVYENEPAGTSILRVRARSAVGAAADIEYYVTNVTGNGLQVDRLFDIDTKLGVLSTATELDREAGVEVYEIEVYAIMVGNGARTSKTKVHVTVLDKNDSPPSFRDVPLQYSVSEDLAAGLPVATVRALDPDTLGTVTYGLLVGVGAHLNDSRHFSLEADTGILRLAESLDREERDVYRLWVRASDGIQETDATIIVQITDTNDNPPAFLEAAYSFDIPENAGRGARIGQVRALDPDIGTNALLTYTVISDWANDVFSLNPQTGVFTLTSRLDYEEVQHYILVVQAQDSGNPSLSSTLTVYCNVIDLNDNAPIFDPMSYSNEIYENVSIGTIVLTVSATDLDSGNNGKIEYSITSGDGNGDFAVTANGTVLTSRPLDRETIATYNLVITATDLAEDAEKRLSTTVQATILLKDVNDMSPEFISPNETTIAENVPLNTVVMAVKTVDKDEGRNGYVEYYLSALTEDDVEVRQVFSLGPVDGLLRVSGQIDRETRSSYVLLVTARDRGDPPRSSQAQLHVRVLDRNDNSPVFDPRQYSAAVAENASIGASVLQVSATDVDEGLNGRVRYSIVDGDTNRDFSIAEDTGVVRVAKNLNYERKSRYLLTVRAEDCSDQEPRTDTTEIAIAVQDINDNPPTFLDSPYLAYVMENVTPPGGGYVLTVRAYDADTPPFNCLVRYFIKEGDTDLFRINASSGEISLLRALDREVQAEYTLSLVAMDTGSPPLTGAGAVKIIVQDVNDHSPEFKRQSYHATISENSPAGTWILTPLATDKDAGLNARIKYSLLGDKIERFHVDQDSGVISTNVLLDREDVDIYRLTLMAQDCSTTEPRAAAVNLTITVLDENDNSPTFSNGKYEVYISDSTQSGQFVFGAKAIDSDIDKNSKITYRISGEHAQNFIINPETGVIKAVYDLFKRTAISYNIEITAEDGGRPTRASSTQLKIFLKPAHLFPTFTGSSITQFTLAENVEEDKLITALHAVSPKKDSVSEIRYAIAGGNVGDALKVDKLSGDVKITGKGLDYEAANQYDVWVEAMDSDYPPLRTALQLVINVTDANDNAPVINKALYNATIMEEESPPLLVVKIQATDVDSGENGQVQYKIVDDFDGTFEIDSDSGEIYTNVKLDREDIPSYEVIVEAVDQGTPTLSGSATVLVNVLDKNDNPPRFTRLFSVNVTENADINSFVIRVTSSDQDIGENANASYSFTENPGGKFKIDSVSGNVTVVGPLDREQQDEYLLKVAAVDGAWRAETPLTITIQDQNDNAPEFEHSYYSFNFPELQRDTVFVGQVTATDRDKQGPNSVISYSLQQPSDLFTVDPANGEIFSKKRLKYKYTQLESSPENMFSLTILATDNGKPPMSSECLLTVNIVDSNNNAPKFEEKEYISPVPEDAIADQRLLQIVAKDDLDFGLNAEVQYSIVSGNGSDYFTIDRQSGWISITGKLRAIGQAYNLKVRAIDKGVPSQQDEAKVTLIITGENRYTPIFTALSYQVIVPENEPVGSTILTVSATDADDGPNGMLRYEISSGNERKEFAIDPVIGAIVILQPLDYDTVQHYRLNITAIDLGFNRRQATSTLTITLTDINDNAPIFNKSTYTAFIAENLPPSSLIYRVKATDADSPRNAIIQYSIIGGSGKDLMAINPKTGDLTAKVSFDFEDSHRYTLKIRASNPDSTIFGTTELIIYVTGVNEYFPHFLHPVFHFDVSESTDIGTSIGKIQATDQDAGDDGKVYYLLVGSSNDKGFSINPDTGVIRVTRNLDRETQSRVILTVMAKNAGGIRGNDTDEAQVIISIQDGNDPPEFLQKVYETNISEGASVGTKVISVKAIDKDVRPQNNQFSYSILEGNTNISFKIDPQMGDVEIISALDRETVPMYTLTVAAIDTGAPPQTGTAIVKIHVSDINDNGPIFDPKPVGRIMENEPANTKIMTLSAKDPDLPPNGAPFTYKLIGGKQRDFVKVDRHIGTILTTKVIDRETTPELEFLIEVEDSGSPKMHSQNTIKIEVIDQNDSPSTARSVHVLVHSFLDLYPLGKIADVHPNDADISGDYNCRIMQGPTVAGLLTIPSGCDLHTSRITPGQGYSLSILGNDGKHPDVVSTVTVEFLSFDNKTIDNSITLQVLNITAQQFLSSSYRALVDILKSSLSNGETLSIFSLQEVDKNVYITIAVRSAKGYKMKSYITERFMKKYSAISQLVMRPVSINYSPCNENICENNGICSEAINIKRTTKIADSQNIIFTSPEISHEYTCQCTDAYTGTNCQKKQDPCTPNPCKSGAQCRRQGYNFQCICPPNKDGKYCDLERGDVCLENPCQNGGSCRENPDGSSFFCLCRPGYRGNQCEALVDSCRPNPCLYGGLCVSMKPGYKCSCTDGRYGQHCEKSTYSFKELSYMIFAPLDAATNDISFIFATTKADCLLVYNYGLQTGGRSDFVAVELVNGKALFSFGGARTAITSIKVAGKENNLANGKWHKIAATRNGRVVSLSVSSCLEQGDSCEDCKPGDMSCYADDIGPAGTLNFNNQPLLIGGLNSANPILERPGQVHSDDFIGCVHSVSINGRQLNLTNPIQAYGVDHSCFSRNTCQQTSEDSCLDPKQCIDRWHSLSCNCGDNLIAPNCHNALQPVSMSEGGYVEFTISKKHRRMQLLEAFYGGSTLWQHHRQIRSVVKETTHGAPSKSVSFMFRTVRENGVLFYATSNKHLTALELRDGQLHYISKLATVVNMTDSHHSVTNGQWHKVLILSQAGGLKIILDDVQIGDELDTVGVHDFLDAYLTSLSLGGVRSILYYSDQVAPQHFEGCIANFTVNNEIQPFNGSGSIFDEVTMRGHVVRDCNGAVGLGAIAAPDPLSIGITLVIVFFVVLLIAILVSFVVFRLRKQSKEKDGVAQGGGSAATKQQNGGNHTILASNGLVVSSVNDNVLSRNLHSNDASLVYHSENGDVIRGISGHSLVGPELLSKKFKEQRDILQGELPRPQRPDIIEREVLTKNQPMRSMDDAHHPPLPPTSNHMHHDHSTDMNSELPEHYDLENASSIAPSDIDIVYHYKGYREAAAAAAAAVAAGGGVRKYKATPPPVGYHHKHTTVAQAQGAHQQHRHSPHHPGVATCYPLPRAPGVVGPGGSIGVVGGGGGSSGRQPPTHQSTPLARLSPSSEMSAQQPRILTLHDISGKPLQSALLATTTSSSGGGVGKDVLHSNSERSLNSPVMSQLSGQSSNNNHRKVSSAPVPSAPSPAGIGLTAEEIERLNSRPRNSSLVSTLDAVSSSSEAVSRGNVMNHHLVHQHQHSAPPVPPPDHAAHHRPAPPTSVQPGSASTGTTSTDESGNDSFTCSEIEYDNASLNGPDDDDDDDKYKASVVGDTPDAPPLPRHHNNNSSNSTLPVTRNSTKNNGLLSPAVSYHDGFDSSYRGSMSTLVASDDEVGGPLYHHSHHHRSSSQDGDGSPHSGVATAAAAAALGWDYLLNWGPNFESLAGVFKDIAELPDTVPMVANGNAGNGGGSGSRLPAALRLTNAPKPSEEYV